MTERRIPPPRRVLTIEQAAQEQTGQSGWTADNRDWMNRIVEAIEQRELQPESCRFWNDDSWSFDASSARINPHESTVSSVNLDAWLSLNASHQDDAARAQPTRETQADRIKRCVSECELRAAKHGEPFDHECMPGTKAEFLYLLHALDAHLRSIKTVDSLDRYLSKAGCKWPLDASAQPSAAPLYARLFPEARIRAPGAVSPQRRKA